MLGEESFGMSCLKSVSHDIPVQYGVFNPLMFFLSTVLVRALVVDKVISSSLPNHQC